MSAQWLSEMRTVEVLAIAKELELDVAPPKNGSGGVIYSCLACGVTRPHARKHIRHGSTGVGVSSDGHGWKCFACDAGGDGLDLVALQLAAHRFRDLDDHGKARVKTWCCDFLRIPRESPRSDRVVEHSRTTDERTYPPQAEVRALWEAASRVDEVAEVATNLRQRGIDATAIADRDLARALAASSRFTWARLDRRSWHSTGHRLLVLRRDASGAARSVVARQVLTGQRGPKSLSPQGCLRAGLVFADELGRRVLLYGRHPSQWPVECEAAAPFAIAPAEWWPATQPLRVVIVEGELDTLSWAVQAGDAAEFPVAVLGIASGAWTQAIADRIPDGSQILLGTDHDNTGEHYARDVLLTLRGRAVEVSRWQAPAFAKEAAL